MEVLNRTLDVLLEPLVQSWKQRGFSFKIKVGQNDSLDPQQQDIDHAF